MRENYVINIPGEDLQDIKSLNITVKVKTKPKNNEYDWSELKPLDLENEDLVQVEWLKYYKAIFPKKQIVLHHTVSGPGISGDLNHWSTFTSHISTCMIIERDGKMNQLFSSKYWGYHTGTGITTLDQGSIGVELDNWGQLERKEGELYTIYDTKVDSPFQEYPGGFREETIFEAYPFKQIWALGELLLYWNKEYGIPLDYHEDMWDISDRALSGEPGIWAHVSFKNGKWDVHPDPQLISMLKALKDLS